MNRFLLPLALLTLALLTLTGPLHAQNPVPGLDTTGGPVKLAIEWRPGKTYLQKMTMTQATKLDVGGGQQVEQTMDMAMDLSMKVRPLPEPGAKEVSASYDRIAMGMEVMGQKMRFDSADGVAAEGNPFAPMGALVGKEFTMILDADNQVTDIKGLEEMIAQSAGNPMAAQAMQQFLDKDQIAQIMNLSLEQVLPKEPVRPGDSWDVAVPISLGPLGTLTMIGTYRLDGFTDRNGHRCAVIGIDTNIDLNPGAGAGEIPGMKIDQGFSKGVLYWDTALGWMRAMEMNQAISMSVKNPAGEGNIVIPSVQRIVIEVDVRDN